MYSQSNEDDFLLNFFGKRKGTLLDIGANDGVTFSNSRALICEGWDAVLVETDPIAFESLVNVYEANEAVTCYLLAISDVDGDVPFWQSGSHLLRGDSGLLSTTSAAAYDKWKGSTAFVKTSVAALSWPSFLKGCMRKKFDFITIDAEGQDLAILRQMDLKALGCKAICVEHNGVNTNEFIRYIASFGFREALINSENLIMIRK